MEDSASSPRVVLWNSTLVGPYTQGAFMDPPLNSGILLVHIGCITQHHRRGETLCNLVCNMNGMLLYLTGNGRVCFLSQVMMWLMENDLSDSAGTEENSAGAHWMHHSAP